MQPKTPVKFKQPEDPDSPSSSDSDSSGDGGNGHAGVVQLEITSERMADGFGELGGINDHAVNDDEV